MEAVHKEGDLSSFSLPGCYSLICFNQHRAEEVSVNYEGNKLYLHGGCNLRPTGDLFCLDLFQWRWTEILVNEDAPLQRFSHQLSISEDDSHLFLFGGVDEQGADCQTLHTADLSARDQDNSDCR